MESSRFPKRYRFASGGYSCRADTAGIQTVLLPDRNVVSRMAQVAMGLSVDKRKRNPRCYK